MNCVDKFVMKFNCNVCLILGKTHGWMTAVCLFVANYIAGHESSICLILLCVILDLFWGIAASVKRGDFAVSELMRYSIAKLSVYGTAIVFFIALDKLTPIDIGITVPIIAGLIVLVECWSFLANAMIVFPHLRALRALRKILTGEIASKLVCTPDEVDELLQSIK